MTSPARAPVSVSESAAPAARRPIMRAFDAFASSAFRLLWLNTLSFALVQGIQRFAFVWLVLDITSGPRAAGFVTFCLGIPMFVLSLPAGVMSDRADRRFLLLWTQLASAGVMLAVAVLIILDAIDLPSTYALAAVTGAALAFGQPVRTAVLPELVGREQLMNAIVLSTLGQNLMMIAGPALGGAVIALWGIEGVFVFQAGAYLLGFLALVPLRLPPRHARAPMRPLHDMREGLAFVRGQRQILVLLGLLVASGLFMMGPIFALLPQIAKEELGREAFAASALFVPVGGGMLLTSLILASLGNIGNKGGWFVANMVLGGAIVLAIGLSRSYELTMALMFLWGMGGGVFINLNRTLVQSHTPLPLMGRVMSIYGLGLAGVAPLGGLLAGALADRIGGPEWLVACGAVLSAISVFVFFTEPGLRRMS